MDEVKLKTILSKHRKKSVNIFIIFSLISLSIHYFYQNDEGLQVLTYSTILAILVFGLAVVMNFVEKVIIDINSDREDK